MYNTFSTKSVPDKKYSTTVKKAIGAKIFHLAVFPVKA